MKNYKILNEEEIKKYSVEKLKAFSDISNLSCTEIGDGNLNNIFRVVDNKTNKSLIIKQAPPYARTSVEMELNAQRCKIEAMSLMEQRKYAKAMVPEVYSYDEELCAMAMEDMTGHSILRTAMMEQVKFPKMAKHAATFFANTLLRTSDVVLGNKLKKDEVARFQNNDLCELTENLVLTQPTFASTRNRIDEYLLPFVKENVYGNSELELAFAQLKYKFITEAQALLHAL